MHLKVIKIRKKGQVLIVGIIVLILLALTIVMTVHNEDADNNTTYTDNNTTLNSSTNITDNHTSSVGLNHENTPDKTSKSNKNDVIEEEVTNKVNNYASQHDESKDIIVATPAKTDESG
ncbi:MAG: hypothetical protein BZ137_06540 [Methanosphaera sp. rholeuAM130]|nr:MAG: hypothetical protein BZ137_06540 [Methanosphaera sp. rholeuAM130]